MGVLQFLWVASLVLAGAAISWMSLLIMSRVVRDRALVRRKAAIETIIQAYLGLTRGETDALRVLQSYRRQTPILAEALLSLLDVVRGGERERLVSSLQISGFDRSICAAASRWRGAPRLSIIEALGVFAIPAAETALRQIARRARGESRLAAVKSLVGIGAMVDLPQLLADMIAQREPWAGSLGDTLRLLAEQQPADCAAAFARVDFPAPVRVMLADALGASGDYKVILVLAEAALTGDSQVRGASVRALGRLMHPASEAVFARAIADSEWQVRGAAANAIGDAGLVSLEPRLVNSLSDPVWWVRFQAAEALVRLGPRGMAALRNAAYGASGETARVAFLTLAERGLK